MHVKVEDVDRKYGQPGNYARCAIARAIMRLFPRYSGVTVGMQTIAMSDRQTRQRFAWATPRIAVNFINRYDEAGVKTAGLEFDLDESMAAIESMRPVGPRARDVILHQQKVVKAVAKQPQSRSYSHKKSPSRSNRLPEEIGAVETTLPPSGQSTAETERRAALRRAR